MLAGSKTSILRSVSARRVMKQIVVIIEPYYSYQLMHKILCNIQCVDGVI